MNGGHTHIEVTAFHEAGHALAALKQGRYVGRVRVNQSSPGSGVTVHRESPRNPFDILREPAFAWHYTFDTTVASMFILLAGPIAEAKLLRKPIRHLGSYSDYNRCLYLAARLQRLAEFAHHYTDIPALNVERLLDDTRTRVRRWAGRPRTWGFIEQTARALVDRGYLDGDALSFAIGSARTPGQLHLTAMPRGSRPMQSPGRPRSRKRSACRL